MSFCGEKAMGFLKRIAFTRCAGTPEEQLAAEIICEELRSLGLKPEIEEFDLLAYSDDEGLVEVVEPYHARYEASVLGLSGNTPDGGIEAPLNYVETGQPESLNNLSGKIVLASEGGGFKSFERAKKEGAIGRIFIGGAGRDTPNIAMNRCIRDRLGTLPTVYVRYEHALEMITNAAEKVRLTVRQNEAWSKSRNVVVDIPGTYEPDEIVIVGAHFDSVYKNQGAHDNGAGSATIMELARHFSQNPPKRTLRFIWFGAEEMGLMGSWAHIEKQKEQVQKYIFMVNVDVAGGIIGNNSASVMGSDKLVNYLDVMGAEFGRGLRSHQSIYSGDCIPLGYEGIPSVTFSRGGGATSYIHAPGDTIEHIDAEHLTLLGDMVLEFTDRIANAVKFPFDREIPEKIKKDIRDYMERGGRTPEDKKAR